MDTVVTTDDALVRDENVDNKNNPHCDHQHKVSPFIWLCYVFAWKSLPVGKGSKSEISLSSFIFHQSLDIPWMGCGIFNSVCSSKKVLIGSERNYFCWWNERRMFWKRSTDQLVKSRNNIFSFIKPGKLMATVPISSQTTYARYQLDYSLACYIRTNTKSISHGKLLLIEGEGSGIGSLCYRVQWSIVERYTEFGSNDH